jgi:hypothetical protein
MMVALAAMQGLFLNQNLGGCRFGITADGQPGYKKAGADTVYPFSSGKHLISAEILNSAKDDPFTVTIDSSGWTGTVTVCCGVFWAYGVSGMQVVLPPQADVISQHDVVAPGAAGYYYNIVFSINVTSLDSFDIGSSTASGAAKFIVYNVFR